MNSSKIALITGITGQDGSLLAELLLEKGYKEVHGLVRRTSSYNTQNIDRIKERLCLHYGDLENEHHLCSLIYEIQPDELYNLAAQSDVGISFEIPEYTGNVTGLGVTRLLEAVRKFSPKSKIYQASTSELYGNAPPPQNEETPMIPRNPYAIAKLYAHQMCQLYREAYGLHIACGILFNHESPRRGINFVTRKITKAACEIAAGRQKELFLGNLDAKRDWGYAPDYVYAMWLMLQQEQPADFVIGTGEVHTVGEFCDEAFSLVGLNWRDYVKIDERYYRATETNYLLANPSKAEKELNWRSTTSFKQLVSGMIDADRKGC